MMDLIDRQAAIDELKKRRALYCDNNPDTFSRLSYAQKSRVDELDTAIATLVNLPSARPKGKWIKGIEVPNRKPFVHLADCQYCSVCHNEAYWDTDYGQQLFDFCPYCGAEMENDNE